MIIGHLLDGARGFDANQRITRVQAKDAVAKGFQFVMRYVRRGQANDHDLIAGELAACLYAGLGVGVVQHVAPEGWIPGQNLGAAYGAVAAEECRAIGIPRGLGVSVWCDLEGVKRGVPAADVIAFCNAWHQRVTEAGYHPGLYVGDSCGLTAVQLYRNLRFDAYWSAYNLNRDQIPAVRGVQMRQKVATLEDLVVGLTNQTMDVDVIHADALGGTPTLLLP
jgi:hypothetical protein